MPVSVWIPAKTLDLTARPAATKPTHPAPKKCSRKYKARKKPLSIQVRVALQDLIEAAINDGRIALCDEDMPCESLDFTLAELAFLLAILFPIDYRSPRKRPRPTATAPGSAERIAEYAARAAKGQALYTTGDARADTAHSRGLRIEQRRNGSGVRVVGWDEE